MAAIAPTQRDRHLVPLAAMAKVPRDRDGNVEYGELHTLLSMGCVEIVVASEPG